MLFLFFCHSAFAVQPISPHTSVYSAAGNITIQRLYTTLPDGVVASLGVKWDTLSLFGVPVHHCSITLVDEFLALVTGNSLSVVEAVFSKTPNGVLWEWTTVVPTNINAWCLQ